MAVSRRETASDSNYSVAIGAKTDLTNREPDIEDVVKDLRDDVNDICDLANLIEGFTLNYRAPVGRNPAKLTITHTASSKTFIIDASN